MLFGLKLNYVVIGDIEKNGMPLLGYCVNSDLQELYHIILTVGIGGTWLIRSIITEYF